MGVELYFQKPNGDLFEMGKMRTGWYHDFMQSYRGEPRLLPSESNLAETLAICAREYGSWEEDLDLDAYCAEVARWLIEWADDEPVVSLTDSADDVDYKRITGSRYNRD